MGSATFWWYVCIYVVSYVIGVLIVGLLRRGAPHFYGWLCRGIRDLVQRERDHLVLAGHALVAIRALNPPRNPLRADKRRLVDEGIRGLLEGRHKNATRADDPAATEHEVRKAFRHEIGTVIRNWRRTIFDRVVFPGIVELAGSGTLLAAGIMQPWGGASFDIGEVLLIIATAVGLAGIHYRREILLRVSAIAIMSETLLWMATTARWRSDDFLDLVAGIAWTVGLLLVAREWRRGSGRLVGHAAGLIALGMLFDIMSCLVTVPGVAARLGVTSSAPSWADVAPIPGLVLLAIALPRVVLGNGGRGSDAAEAAPEPAS